MVPAIFEITNGFQGMGMGKRTASQKLPRAGICDHSALIGDREPVFEPDLAEAGQNGREHAPRDDGENPARRTVGFNRVNVLFRHRPVPADERAVKIR